MKSYKVLIIITLSLFLLSCSGYNKLLKSDDIEAKYNESIRLYHAKKYSKSIGLFENILANLIGTPREDTMLFYMGKSHYNLKQYDMAMQTFDAYRDRFTRSQYVEEAEYLYAMCHYFSSLPVEKDQKDTRSAIVAFNEYLNRYPNSVQKNYIQDLIEELTQKLYYKTYLNSALYHKLGHYNAAITALRSAIKENPEIPYREEMMYLICRSWFDYARNSIFSRQLDRYMKMSDSYYNFIATYPESKQFRKELDKMFNDSQEFIQQYGLKSQEAQKSENILKQHRENIKQAKEKLFSTDTKQQETELRNTIKHEREAIKNEKQVIKKQKENLKLEQKLIGKPSKKSTKNNDDK